MEAGNKIVFYATCLNGKDRTEVELQYRLILQMIISYQRTQEIDEEDFLLMAEEIAGNRPLSMNYTKKLVKQTEIFRYNGEYWEFNDELYFGGDKVSFEQLAEVFLGKQDSAEEGVKADDKKTAIIRGVQWCVNMVQLARKSDMKGLPAFLRCGEEDSLIGKNVAGTATSDALSLICYGEDFIKECGIEPDILINSVEFLVRKILGCQCKLQGWDEGGFFPLEDQPEAEHPTVDATCLAIVALSKFYSNRKVLEENLDINITVESCSIEDAVLSGVRFLIRMQQPGGSYGIYRYEDEEVGCINGTLPNDNCTRMAMYAMGISRGSGILAKEEHEKLYQKCREYINEAYNYLKAHTAEYQGHFIWAPYFGASAANYPEADLIISTARVCRSLYTVWEQFEEKREEIKKYHIDFFEYWKQHNVKGEIGKYAFKTPGKNGYSSGMYAWYSYPEMIAAFTVLQGYNRFGIALSKADWGVLEEVVQNVLDMQHTHGHWNSPSDIKKPFCAATLAAIELLREYRTAKEI